WPARRRGRPSRSRSVASVFPLRSSSLPSTSTRPISDTRRGAEMRVAVLTISDTTSRGERADGSGDAAVAWVSTLGGAIAARAGRRGGTLIVNLTGATSGVRDMLAAFEPIARHAVDIVRGSVGSHDAEQAGRAGVAP